MYVTILPRCRLVCAAVCAAVCAVAGCSSTVARDRRDAPWDGPVESRFDQIPAWEGAALRRCGGQVHPDKRTAHMTDRC